MTLALCVGIVCLTALIAQHFHHSHQRDMQAERSLLHKVEQRVSAIERKGSERFDPAAFEDLMTKVEALRVAQGFKRG